MHAGKLSHKEILTSNGKNPILFDIKNQAIFHNDALVENRHSDIVVKADSCFVKGKMKVVAGILNFSINKHLVIGLSNTEIPTASDLFPLTKPVTINAKELNVVAGAYVNLANMCIGRTLKTSSLLRIEFLAIKAMFSSIQNALFVFDFLNVNIPNPASIIELVTKVIKLDFSYIKKEFLTLSMVISTVSSLVNQLKIIAPGAGQVAGIVWSLTQLSMTLPSMVKQTKLLIKNSERSLRDVIPIIVGLKSGLTIGANLANQSSVLYDSVEQENFDLLALNEIDSNMLISSLKTAMIAIGNLNSSDALIESNFLDFHLSTTNIERNLLELDAGNISVALFLQNISQLSFQEHSLTIAETAILEGHQANLDHTDIVSNKLVVALSGDLNQSSGEINSHDANIHAETLNQNGNISLDKANVAVTEHQVGQQGKYIQEGGTYQSEKTDVDTKATFIQANTISNIALLENRGDYQAKECITKGKQYHNQGKAQIIDSQMDYDNYQSTKESQNTLDGSLIVGTQAQMAGLNQLNKTKFVEKEKIDVDKETSLKATGAASMEAQIINFNADSAEVDNSLLLNGQNELNMSENSHIEGDGILGLQSEKANISAQIETKTVLGEFDTLTQQEGSHFETEEFQLTANHFDQNGNIKAEASNINITDNHHLGENAEFISNAGQYDANTTTNEGQFKIAESYVDIKEFKNGANGSFESNHCLVTIDNADQQGELHLLNETVATIANKFEDGVNSHTQVDDANLQMGASVIKGEMTTNEAFIASETIMVVEESASIDVEGDTCFQSKQMKFEAEAKLNNESILSLKTDGHLDVTKEADFDGKNATLILESETCNFKASGDVATVFVEVEKLEDLENFVQGTGDSGKLHVTEKLIVNANQASTITGHIERATNIISVTVKTMDIEHAQAFEGSLYVKSTEGHIKVGAHVSSGNDILFDSAGDV